VECKCKCSEGDGWKEKGSQEPCPPLNTNTLLSWLPRTGGSLLSHFPLSVLDKSASPRGRDPNIGIDRNSIHRCCTFAHSLEPFSFPLFIMTIASIYSAKKERGRVDGKINEEPPQFRSRPESYKLVRIDWRESRFQIPKTGSAQIELNLQASDPDLHNNTGLPRKWKDYVALRQL
jgi:hypothetical protein